MNKSNKPLVSVIVTTRDEEDVIGRLLESIQSQTYKNIETIIVDNNSVDETKSIAKKYHIKTFNYGPERSAQRNYGAFKSEGIYLLFLDADMKLTNKVIKDCVVLVQKDEKTGAIVIPEESIASNYWEEVKKFERSFYEAGDDKIEAARFIRSTVFKEVGGYDENITGPEDWDLSEMIIKKGYEIRRVKSVIYHYERISSLFSLMKKKYYYGLKSYKYLKKNDINVFGPKTIYFLRPAFYKNWKRLIMHPLLSSSMIIMFIVEILAGGAAYFTGRWRLRE